MSAASLLLCLALNQTSVEPFQINYLEETFIVRGNELTERVPLQLPKPKPTLSVAFRKNTTFAVWDDRGLTIRHGRRVRSTRLPEIAVSPRAFEREQILETLDKIKAKDRRREASGLSGARRVGNFAYFLVRWNERNGSPWLEALVRVDLNSPTSKPEFVGRFGGLSTATAAIDDRMFLREGRLAILARATKEWGLATYDLAGKRFDFQALGENLETVVPAGQDTLAFIERTAYGTRVAGELDLTTLTRRELAEVRGRARFLDGDLPRLLVANNGREAVIRNLDSGSELRLPASSSLRRTRAGVLVWSPVRPPKRATLYDPARWSPRAEWAAPDAP